MSDTDYNQVLDSFAKKSALVASLEACHWLSDTRRRAVVIAELPSSIKSQIVSGNDARQDILTVVSRCLEYLGGIEQLLEIVRWAEGDSVPRRNLDKTLQEMVKAAASPPAEVPGGARFDIPPPGGTHLAGPTGRQTACPWPLPPAGANAEREGGLPDRPDLGRPRWPVPAGNQPVQLRDQERRVPAARLVPQRISGPPVRRRPQPSCRGREPDARPRHSPL